MVLLQIIFNLNEVFGREIYFPPYLFIVAVETLAVAIRQNQEIRGISIKNEDSKILQYADDTTAVLLDISSAEQLLFELLNLLRTFHVLKLTAKKRRLCGLSRPKKIKQNLLEPNGLMS